MNYETADAPVGDYPFTAVTICSQNKISKTKLKHVLRNARYKQITEAQMVLMTGVMMHIPTARNRTIELVQIRHLLNEIGISLEELINITMQVAMTLKIFITQRFGSIILLIGDGNMRRNVPLLSMEEQNLAVFATVPFYTNR